MNSAWISLKPVVGKLVSDAKASVHVRNDGQAIVTITFSDFFLKKIGKQSKKCHVTANPDMFAIRIQFAVDGDFDTTDLNKGGARLRIPSFHKLLESDRELTGCRTDIDDGGGVIYLPEGWKTQKPVAFVPPKAPVVAPEPVEVDGSKVDLAKYLRLHGRKASKLAGGFYQVDRERIPFNTALEIANLLRRKQNLPPFLQSEIA